ncbi:putative ERMES regulator 1 [[Candida] jaroonii]|uniref:ERMES regulator 1 n=1 Tax=[Candida] jaroonii TaxID=467808 RepID=A0ACA9Y9J0_9ASCO|nr:putative ERMES regulator 1 [[Candida] jaroonii]
MIINSIRRIFSSFRTEEEERYYSRTAFFNLLGFLGSCVLFSFVAQRLSKHPREIAQIARANALIKAISN